MEPKKLYLSPLAEILCFEPRGAFALLTGESQNEYKDTQALFGTTGAAEVTSIYPEETLEPE